MSEDLWKLAKQTLASEESSPRARMLAQGYLDLHNALEKIERDLGSEEFTGKLRWEALRTAEIALGEREEKS